MASISVRYTGAEDYNNYLSYLIAGPPGKGKTRFAATAKDPYLLNAEAGTMSIATKHVPTTEIDSSETLMSVRNILALGPKRAEEILGFPVGTVIIDTFDEVARIVIHERLEREKKDVMATGDWMWLADHLGAIIRGFQSLEMDVIFTCHVKDQQDGDTGAVYLKLDISGATANQLPANVDEAFILDDRNVIENIDGVETTVRRQFLFTSPNDRCGWIKDHSGQLDEVIELNFEDDFQRIVAKIRDGGVNLKSGETRDVEIPEETQSVVEPPPAPTPATTPASAATAISEAEETIAKAERAKKRGGERSTVTGESSPSDESASAIVDIENAKNGDMITLDGDVPAGFQLNSQQKVLQVKGIRFIYRVDGKRVLSRNQLQKHVLPQMSTLDTGIFCQVSGKEVTPEEANISRIRYRKVLCEEEFSKLLDAGKDKR